MGSTISLPTVLKTPLSYLTGDDTATSPQWLETDTAFALRIDIPSLKPSDSVFVTLLDSDSNLHNLKITAHIKGTFGQKSSTFTKLVSLPENENGGLFYEASVVSHVGFAVVTVPKLEEV